MRTSFENDGVTDTGGPRPSRPLEVLFERQDLPRFALPAPLAIGYGGALGFASPRVIANFVESVDGIVVLRDGGESGHVISGSSEADRFVMGLLRSCADAVLVGAGTLRNDPHHRWIPATIYPEAAAVFAEARRDLGLRPQPTLVVVTASGEIAPGHAALADAIIVTTSAGASALRDRVPPTARVVAFDRTEGPVRTLGGTADELRARSAGPVPLRNALAWLRAAGMKTILTEGGPKLFANLLADGLVDELFLTLSPRLFGRRADDQRRSLVDGHDLGGSPLGLLSARRHGSHLFLRYALKEADSPGRETRIPTDR